MTTCLSRNHLCLNNPMMVLSSLSHDQVESTYHQVIEYAIQLDRAKIFLLEQCLLNSTTNASFFKYILNHPPPLFLLHQTFHAVGPYHESAGLPHVLVASWQNSLTSLQLCLCLGFFYGSCLVCISKPIRTEDLTEWETAFCRHLIA